MDDEISIFLSEFRNFLEMNLKAYNTVSIMLLYN